ncbi:MAG: ribonuclease R [Deltaproteobacteria bacterium]|nr:ribonuclease R [Deltaproteobacteria bacterium]
MIKTAFADILKKFELPLVFPPEVLKEAEAIPSRVLLEEIQGRVDLRSIPIVTIDGETAKDFDDAVAVQKSDHSYRLWVSIADVSHYVRPKTALDAEASSRATSVYFPGDCLPMLPEKLSNGICSLNPHEDRLTFTAEIDFDFQGRPIRSQFYKSVIKSCARLTYTIVRKILVDREEAARKKWHSLIGNLELLEELADKIGLQRTTRGSIDFDLPEPEIVQDLEEGKVEKIVKAERNKAHRIIEELMIAANEAVARFVTEKGNPMVYRTHDKPDPEKLANFRELLHNLGIPLRMGKTIRPAVLADLLRQVKGLPEEKLINTMMLRSMKQAVYGTDNIGHFGLASECYTHFTSPIRRYPDLVVHRILAGIVGAGSPRPGAGTAPLQQISKHCSERERVAMKAEYASRDQVACQFMKGKVGEVYEGIIAGVTKFGFFVELIAFFVEGLVPMRKLKDDYYVYHEKHQSLVGRKTKRRFRIGDRISVKVAGVNLEKRWIDLEVQNSK